MFQKFTISWFRREAGLLFFTISFIFILTFTDIFGLSQNASLIALADEKPIVVVIDPGHGGENLGGEYEDYTEKEMTLIVAKAMKEELEQYEGITVYLTRTNDTELSLEERCEYASYVGADFLFCLHFNLSENHTLFGAETWISAFGEQYSRGYAFASIEMELLQEMGLYSRGIKTRLNNDGVDYYGIIRHATERNLPCVLIEHCHLDQENDKPFYDHKEKLEAFGRLDAEAVARYYGLYSESLGKDFRGYQNISVEIPTQTMKPDMTEPDICMIELVKQNMNTGHVTISVSAADYDSGILYYSYSNDGGMTFSTMLKWPDKTKDTFTFTMQVPSGIVPQIVVNAYNGYDLYTTSNLLSLPSMDYETEKEEKEEPSADAQDAVESTSDQILPQKDDDKITYELPAYKLMEETAEQEQQPPSIAYFIKVCLICTVLVLAMILSMLMILKSCKRKKKRRRIHR